MKNINSKQAVFFSNRILELSPQMAKHINSWAIFWHKSDVDTVRGGANIEHYIKILEHKGLIKKQNVESKKKKNHGKFEIFRGAGRGLCLQR